MGIRLRKRKVVVNDDAAYKTMASERGIKFFTQYVTPKMRYPTAEEIQELDVVNHIWRQGDRFWKLADRFYGDAELWWLIAWFNQTPTESCLEQGQVVSIPLPLEKALMLSGV